jgi:hypothetical protein
MSDELDNTMKTINEAFDRANYTEYIPAVTPILRLRYIAVIA